MLYAYTTFVLNSSNLLKRDFIADKLETTLRKIMPQLYNQKGAAEQRVPHKGLNHSSWQDSQPSAMVRGPKKFWDV